MSQSQNTPENDFSARLHRLRQKLGLTQEEISKELGISSNYVSLLEGGKKRPSQTLRRALSRMEAEKADEVAARTRAALSMIDGESPPRSSRRRDEVSTYDSCRMIGVVGWAHAGEAQDYEELPSSWQERVPTECRDPQAFAVRLEGESMTPRYEDGDVLVLMPNEEIYSGVLAVVRLVNGGVVFRRIEIRGERLRLVPFNERYEVEEFSEDEISWAYPLWGSWRQSWKR